MIKISQFKNIPKEHRINYVANTIHQKDEHAIYNTWSLNDRIYDLIDRSFCWKYSPQGHVFWNDLALNNRNT
jgi:hypothetical protein